MTRATDEVISEYYDILTAGAEAYDEGSSLRPLLADELVFEGPVAGRVVGADPFLKGVTGFVETVRRIDVLHRAYDGDVVASLYDAELPNGIARLAEFHQVTDGRIQSLRLLFDAATYLSVGGR